MIETTALLRAYADLILRFSGAGAVTLVLNSLREGEDPTVVTAGDLPAVDELSDTGKIAALEDRFARRCESCDDDGPGPCPMDSEESGSDCVLFRIPVAGAGDDAGHARDGRRRRAADGSTCSDLAVWLGLRYSDDTEGEAPAEEVPKSLQAMREARSGSGESDGWNRVLRLAAALAAHTRAVARVLEDPLTGLPARAGFRTEFGLAIDRAKLSGRPLALILINPDGYAEINRKLGRSAGDAVLAEIAERLRGRVRASDRVARYGGATFGVVLGDVSVEDAERLADGIREHMDTGRYGDGEVTLRFSVGVVGIDPLLEDVEGDPVAHWIRRADEALFQAKLEGGGRSSTWTPSTADAPGHTVDRLQGMFTGDVNTDYRNMAMLWELVQLIAEGGAVEDLCRKVTQRMQGWLPAKIVAIVEPDAEVNGGLRVLSSCVDGEEAAAAWSPHQRAKNEIAVVLESGVPRMAGPGRKSGSVPTCSIPLSVDDRVTGCLYLEARESDDCRDVPEPRFFAALASQLAIAIDRTRLGEAERAREVEKREILESEVEELRRVIHSTRLSYTSASMRSVIETVRKIAPTEATVLVTGESGTGKELLARTIHQLGDRRDFPLIVVDCGAISATLIDSELFGHEKGAFTGSHGAKIGRLAEADGATVFLDEIGELPIDVQSKLLRFVQEKTVTPVGGTKSRKVDARIIAATNVDLASQVRSGSFREDLYHRLNVVRIHLPPLRERRSDIVHLARVFLQQYSALYRKEGLRFAVETERELERRPWTGNVRELQNRMMRAVLFAEGDVLRPEHFDDSRDHDTESSFAPEVAADAAPEEVAGDVAVREPHGLSRLRDVLDREVDAAIAGGSTGRPLGKWLEADLAVAAEDAAGGVARQAADLLGLPDTTFRRRLAKAKQERDAGLAVRSDTWGEVRQAIDALLSEPVDAPDGLAAEVERTVLEAIVGRCGDKVRTGSALLGVTEPTYLKRRASYGVGVGST